MSARLAIMPAPRLPSIPPADVLLAERQPRVTGDRSPSNICVQTGAAGATVCAVWPCRDGAMTSSTDTEFPLEGRRVYVAGHRGLVGSALVRRLAREGCAEILTVGRDELDLRDQAVTLAWMMANRPDAVFLAAARVGGIAANAGAPGSFLYDNLMIAANVIEAARVAGTP